MELIGLFFIGVPFSVLVLFGIIKFIGITEKEKEDERNRS
tara:strand:- start:410 stop:529 length:120 start_codon:yes stop_codon:yes gene_type:complete